MNLRQQRIAKGLCPECGAEAAPYYVCPHCRFKQKLSRILNKMAHHGGVTVARDAQDRRKRRFWRADLRALDDVDYREAQEGDRRLRPRLRGIPVDVERELLNIFERANNGLTIEEVYEAWGTLRLRPNRTSAAADMAQIVEAKRKRADKLARRAERNRKQMAMGQGL